MEKINGIIIEGKIFVATGTNNSSCLMCDLIEEDSSCPCRNYCFYIGGYYNCFRYSPELTERLKGGKA